MNKKIDFAELEQNVDFDSLSQKLDDLSASGGLIRPKKAGDVLDKMKPALLRARENKVSIKALTEFLNDSGIPVSMSTLREYFRLEHKRPKKSKKRNGSAKVKPTPEPNVSGEDAARPLPPRLARREEK